MICEEYHVMLELVTLSLYFSVWSEIDIENIIKQNLFSEMQSERRVINVRGFLGINKPRFSSRSDQRNWRRPVTYSDGKENDQQYIR